MPRPAKSGTRERLLAAGLETFHRRGYANTGVQDIVSAAGVPKGSFYNHFASKEALAVAAVDAYWATLRPTVVEALSGSGKGLARLQALFRGTACGILAGELTNGCFMGQIGLELAGHSDEVRDHVASAMAEWTALLANVVEQGQRDGSIRASLDARTVARATLDAYEGALMRARIDGSPEPMRAFIEFVLPAMAGASAEPVADTGP